MLDVFESLVGTVVLETPVRIFSIFLLFPKLITKRCIFNHRLKDFG